MLTSLRGGPHSFRPRLVRSNRSLGAPVRWTRRRENSSGPLPQNFRPGSQSRARQPKARFRVNSFESDRRRLYLGSRSLQFGETRDRKPPGYADAGDSGDRRWLGKQVAAEKWAPHPDLTDTVKKPIQAGPADKPTPLSSPKAFEKVPRKTASRDGSSSSGLRLLALQPHFHFRWRPRFEPPHLPSRSRLKR